MKRDHQENEFDISNKKPKRDPFEKRPFFSFADAIAKGKYELRLLVSRKSAGGIIGVKGENIKRLRNEFDAQVAVPASDTPERTVSLITVIEKIIPLFQDVLTRLEDLSDIGKHEVRFLIHQSHAGALIGRAGSKIKELRETTSSQIKVYQNVAPKSTDRICLVIGDSSGVTNTARLIVEELRNVAIKGGWSNYDANNYDPQFARQYGGFISDDFQAIQQASRHYDKDFHHNPLRIRRGGTAGTSFGGASGPSYGGAANPSYSGTAGTSYPGAAGSNYSGTSGTTYGRASGPNYGGTGPIYSGAVGSTYGTTADPNYSGVAGTSYGGNAGTNYRGAAGSSYGGGVGHSYAGTTRTSYGGTAGPNYHQMNMQQMNAPPPVPPDYEVRRHGGRRKTPVVYKGGEPIQSDQVTIPADLGGAIIGRNGKRIKRIREQSGCSITVEPLTEKEERIITITGTAREIAMAQWLLQNAVTSSDEGQLYYPDQVGTSSQ